MSEGPQGEGWWIASDGKWYPPELHPDAVAARGAVGSAPVGGGSGPAAASGGSTLQQPQGGWTAPAPDPWIARMQAQAAAGGTPAGGDAGWAASPGGPASRRLRGRGLPRRKALVVVPLVVLLLAGAGVGIALGLSGSSAPDTPRAVAQAAVADFDSGSLASLCNLVLPSSEQQCRAGMIMASVIKLTTHDLAVGVVTQQGSEALAVLTGTLCVAANTAGSAAVTPQCETNTDPNAALDGSGSFAEAYTRATTSSQTGQNFTIPMLEQGGHWYLALS